MDAKQVLVFPRASTVPEVVVNLTMWAVLVCGVPVLTRVLLGYGIVVVDIFSLIVGFLLSFQLIQRFSGAAVRLTRDECAAWVRDGQPADVATWKMTQAKK